MMRRFAAALLAVVLAAPLPVAASTDAPALSRLLEEAAEIDALETVVVAVDGKVVAERGYRGHDVRRPANIKSASKAVISALVGIAIDKGLLEGDDQRVATLLDDRLPPDADPRLVRVTIGHLLSMQAGLGSTSGAGYGAWVASRDWVRAALARPFADEPGGRMIYSTGNTHLLAAILTRVAGRPLADVARDWFRPLPDFRIASWSRDPQGIHFGGNQMAMTPRSLLAFGELYRTGGLAPDGTRVLSADWVERSWRPRTRSVHTGDGYGYGWFLTRVGEHEVHYAWGYGGQMLYVVPGLGLSVVMTSDETRPSAGTGHRARLNGLLARIAASVAGTRVGPGLERASGPEPGAASGEDGVPVGAGGEAVPKPPDPSAPSAR